MKKLIVIVVLLGFTLMGCTSSENTVLSSVQIEAIETTVPSTISIDYPTPRRAVYDCTEGMVDQTVIELEHGVIWLKRWHVGEGIRVHLFSEDCLNSSYIILQNMNDRAVFLNTIQQNLSSHCFEGICMDANVVDELTIVRSYNPYLYAEGTLAVLNLEDIQNLVDFFQQE